MPAIATTISSSDRLHQRAHGRARGLAQHDRGPRQRRREQPLELADVALPDHRQAEEDRDEHRRLGHDARASMIGAVVDAAGLQRVRGLQGRPEHEQPQQRLHRAGEEVEVVVAELAQLGLAPSREVPASRRAARGRLQRDRAAAAQPRRRATRRWRADIAAASPPSSSAWPVTAANTSSRSARAVLRQQLGRLALLDQPAVVHDRQPVAVALGLLHQVRGHDDRRAGLARAARAGAPTRAAARVGSKPDGRLVEEEHRAAR